MSEYFNARLLYNVFPLTHTHATDLLAAAVLFFISILCLITSDFSNSKVSRVM